jgi:nitroreductase
VLLDAGHLAQNLLLVCEDLRLAAVPLGGFQDDALAELLGLDPSEEAPLYAILIGATRR